MSALLIHPNPLPTDIFAQIWKEVSDYREFQSMNAQMRTMASSFPLFLGQATLWVWHNQEEVFPALSMPTDQGILWGLPCGNIVNNELFVASQALEHLRARPEDVRCLPAKSINTLRRQLPDGLSSGHWNKDSFQNLGVGMILERTAPTDQLNLEELIEAMAQFSCHPYFGRRIVEDIIQSGSRITTVTAQLGAQMEQVANALAPLGVKVSRTWAKPGAGHSDNLPPDVDPSYEAHLRPGFSLRRS